MQDTAIPLIYPAPSPYPPPDGIKTQQPVEASGYPPSDPNYIPPEAQAGMTGSSVLPTNGTTFCPRGLEYLTMVDQLIINEETGLINVFSMCDTKIKYSISNVMEQKIFVTEDDTGCCARKFVFDMRIKDFSSQEVMHVNKPLRCDCCLCACCLEKIEITAPPGTVIGSVTQEWSIFNPSFRVDNAAGECVLRIKAKCCDCLFIGNGEYQIVSPDGKFNVGRIAKQVTNVLNVRYEISFPMDLDVNMKAVLLGACFLIDYMSYEKQMGSF